MSCGEDHDSKARLLKTISRFFIGTSIIYESGEGYMPAEYKKNYMNRYFKLHRALYVVLLGIVIACQIKGLTPGKISMIYYIPVLVGCFFLDELYQKKQDKISEKYHSLRITTEIFLLSLGNLFGPPHPLVFMSMLLFELMLCFEDMLLYDIFDDYHIFIRRVVYMSLIVLGMVVCFRNVISGPWIFIEILVGTVLVGSCFIIFHSFTNGIRMYERQTTDLYFKYVNLSEERDKLQVYQDRVEAVNDEINFQKLNLEKANRDLKTMNMEVRSLIEVMKDFTSSFDVPGNATRMLENIMEIKSPGVCGIYIREGVFRNESPYMQILSGSSNLQSALARDFYTIFDKLRIRGGTEPMVLAENKNFREAVLSDTTLVNVVAFPAFENDTYYGVMVVASAAYDFFDSGYSFYESSLVDFTVALRSAKLYLEMENMARKDGLTGVYNRAYFNEIYPNIMAKCVVDEKSLCLAMLDIDKFKSINDTYGHLAGDEVIKMVASVDHVFAQKYKGYAVRYGGEEFLLIIPGLSVDGFKMVLEEVHDEIVRNVVHFEGEEIHVNASIGMSQYPDIAKEVVDVLDQSDQAMYFSKEHGRGMIVIYGREEESLRELKIEESDTKVSEIKDSEIKDSEIKGSEIKESEIKESNVTVSTETVSTEDALDKSVPTESVQDESPLDKEGSPILFVDIDQGTSDPKDSDNADIPELKETPA